MRKALIFSLAAFALAGCSGLKPAVHEGEPAPPASVSEARLTPQLMYQVLLAEMMVKRGDHDGAFRLLKPLVEETRDPQLAQRLFQLSMQTYRVEAIEEASLLWHEIEPANPKPLRALWLLKLRHGDVKEALALFDRYQRITPEPLAEDLELAAQRVAGAIEAKTAIAFAEALRQRYGTWAADYAAGIILLDKERPEAALKAFRAALEKGADEGRIYPYMARAWLAMGQAQEGLQQLRDYVEAHPDNWQLQAEYARLEVEVGDFAAAEKRFERVLSQQPDADMARLALGLLQFEQGKLEAAARQFERLLRNPVTRQVAAFYLAQVYEEQGALKKAAAYYAQISSPKYRLDARLRLVGVIYRLEGLEAALRLLDRLSAQNDRDQARLLLARLTLYAKAGRRDEALAVADRILANPAADRDTLMQLAGELYELKADERYERALRRVLEMAPDDADALNALGYFFVERNRNLEEAERLLFRAIERKPRAFYIEDSIGWLYWRKGELDKAAEWLRRALSREADSEVLGHLLQVEAARGNRQALEALRKRYRKLFEQDAKLRQIWRKIEKEMDGRRPASPASK